MHPLKLRQSYVSHLEISTKLVPHNLFAFFIEHPPEVDVLSTIGQQNVVVKGVEAARHDGVCARL